MDVLGTDMAGVSASQASSSVLSNAAQGSAFQKQGLAWLDGFNSTVEDEVSVRPLTQSGAMTDYRVRLDAIATSENGLGYYDFKSSDTAGFTQNQKTGYDLIKQFGGQVVGNNGGFEYPNGMVLPPAPVTIVRPGDIL